MEIVFLGENLHEISILFSGKNKNIISLSSAEFGQGLVTVNDPILVVNLICHDNEYTASLHTLY